MELFNLQAKKQDKHINISQRNEIGPISILWKEV